MQISVKTLTSKTITLDQAKRHHWERQVSRFILLTYSLTCSSCSEPRFKTRKVSTWSGTPHLRRKATWRRPHSFWLQHSKRIYSPLVLRLCGGGLGCIKIEPALAAFARTYKCEKMICRKCYAKLPMKATNYRKTQVRSQRRSSPKEEVQGISLAFLLSDANFLCRARFLWRREYLQTESTALQKKMIEDC